MADIKNNEQLVAQNRKLFVFVVLDILIVQSGKKCVCGGKNVIFCEFKCSGTRFCEKQPVSLNFGQKQWL